MRFTSVLVAGALALGVSAQDASPTTSAAAPSPTVDDTVQRCLKACPESDVNCRAKCVPVPSPNDDQANKTNECVAQCPQGTGTEADNEKYKVCVDNCIGQYYFPEGQGGSGGGSSGGSGPGSSGSPSGTGSQNGSPTNSGSPSNATQSPGAASTVGVTGLSFVGFLAALFAL